MHLRRLLFPLTLLLALCCATGAQALPTVKGGTWHTEYITEADGTELHAAVLRPDDLAPGEKTPVVMTVSVYDNASGEFGAAGPVEGIDYDPVGPSKGAVANYEDFIADAAADGEGLHLRDRRPARLRAARRAARTGPARASRPTSSRRSSGLPRSRGPTATSASTASPTTASPA